MYGTGTNVDQLLSGTAELTYNVPHWKLGVEYNLTSAWYGSLNHSNGKVVDTHSVSNNRLVATALFIVLREHEYSFVLSFPYQWRSKES